MKKPRSPSGLRATKLELGGETLVVLSHPVPRAPAPGQTRGLTPGLTPAELEVRVLLLQGASYADIARARGTTLQTVRKQAHAIYSKLGISGRRELAASPLGPAA